MGALATIPNIPDTLCPSDLVAKDIPQVVDNMRVLKKALEAAHKYGEYAQKYIRLEAQTYLDIINSGADWYHEKLHGTARKVLEYLQRLRPQERQDFVDKCIKDNCRLITAVHYEEKCHDKKRNTRLGKKRRDELIEKFNNEGRINLKYEFFWGNSDFERNAYKDAVKDAILRSGGVGIGDSEYINPEIATKRELGKAIGIRAQSIKQDIDALSRLCLANKSISDQDFLRYVGWEHNSPNKWSLAETIFRLAAIPETDRLRIQNDIDRAYYASISR